jgi:hypothetical protein
MLAAAAHNLNLPQIAKATIADHNVIRPRQLERAADS